MDAVDTTFETLLTHVREMRGFDFTGYKRSSLMRRVSLRMDQLGVAGFADYLDYLQVHPDEFTVLFNTIMINVTSFFRDPDAWDYLQAEVLVPMVKAKAPGSPIRVWSAGCASGEEAYTVAVLLGEILGPAEFRERVKIYATDVDEEQLAQARLGVYDTRAVEAIPADLVGRYFDQAGDRHTFRKDMRRSLIFGRNDLMQDAPISRIDVLTCRNTLMYFNAETQARILGRFHFALVDGGTLFLGKAEMLLNHSSLFTPADLKRRVFRKAVKVPPPAAPAGAATGPEQLRTAALLAGPVAQLVVSADGDLAFANRQADALFALDARDLGRPFRDLEVSYRPVELRGFIDQALAERRPLHVGDTRLARAAGEAMHLDVHVVPLFGADSGLLGVTLLFHDVTAARRLRADLERANHELEKAYEALQSTNEELETTNEELQSTVEELETTNEELQSTNEELETMNEELHSTNDDLQTINERLHQSGAELDAANEFLDSVLSGLRAGVAVIDREMRVRAWNREAENLWGLRAGETVGGHLLNLDIGLPVDALRPAIRQALTGDTEVRPLELEAINRRGRPVTVRVGCSPLPGGGDEPTGAIIVMEQAAQSG